eukprot:gb/GECG01015114.1/.p1 GENE.gb/GECG01015114.1/~~gb/GECG01015114.1/.p1  ORF type:complete len:923 (+),score=110.46 gb/GECG01015114.1/:1-2769(+)
MSSSSGAETQDIHVSPSEPVVSDTMTDAPSAVSHSASESADDTQHQSSEEAATQGEGKMATTAFATGTHQDMTPQNTHSSVTTTTDSSGTPTTPAKETQGPTAGAAEILTKDDTPQRSPASGQDSASDAHTNNDTAATTTEAEDEDTEMVESGEQAAPVVTTAADPKRKTTPSSNVPVPSWEINGYFLPGKLQHGGSPVEGVSPRFPPLNQLARIPFVSKFDPGFGNLLALGLSDGTLQIWNAASNNLVADIDAHTGPIVAVSWSGDSAKLCTLCQSEWCIRVWDLRHKKAELELFTSCNIIAADFHPLSDKILAVLPFGDTPYLVHFSDDGHSYDVKKLSIHWRSTSDCGTNDGSDANRRVGVAPLGNMETLASMVWGPPQFTSITRTADRDCLVTTPLFLCSSKGCIHLNWVNSFMKLKGNRHMHPAEVSTEVQDDDSLLSQVASVSLLAVALGSEIVNNAASLCFRRITRSKREEQGLASEECTPDFRLFSSAGDTKICVICVTIARESSGSKLRCSTRVNSVLGNPLDPLIEALGRKKGQQILIESGSSLGLNMYCTPTTAARYTNLHNFASCSGAGTGGLRANTLCCSGNGESVAVAVRTKNDNCIAVWSSEGDSVADEFVVSAILVGDHVSLSSESAVSYGDRKSDNALLESIETASRKDGISSCSWHPKRQMLYAGSRSGLVRVWKAIEHESWSAFSKWFEELRRNIHYIEREDEFDLWEERNTTENDCDPSNTASIMFSTAQLRRAVSQSFVPQDLGKTAPLTSVPAPTDAENDESSEKRPVKERTRAPITLTNSFVGSHPGKTLGLHGVDVLHRSNKRNFKRTGHLEGEDSTKFPSRQKKVKLHSAPDAGWAVYSEGLRRLNDVGKHAGLEPTLFYDPDQKLQGSLETAGRFNSGSKASAARSASKKGKLSSR